MKQISSRFSIAVHILTLIAHSPKECTGDFIAGSVNTNPVIIRKIMGMLKKAELVEVRPGVGGASLLREADRITLLDVLRAVEVIEDDSLFNFHDEPNVNCPVGRNIEAALRKEMLEAQTLMEKKLNQVTLEDLIADFR